MDTINKLIEDYAEAKAKFQKNAKDLLMQEFKTFFKEVPEIKVIKWTQYTPYFNDRDACVFGVHEPTFSNCEDSSLVMNWGELDMNTSEAEEKGIFVFYGDYGIPDNIDAKARKKIEDINYLICNSSMREALEGAFGDHVEVTVTENGIDIDEYEHD
jgi:hypothetical protein